VRRDRAEDAVDLSVRSGGKEQSAGRSVGAAVTEGQAPQAINLDRQIVDIQHVSDPGAGADVVRRDRSTTEITDQQIVAEAAEAGWRLHYSPGSVQIQGVRHANLQVALRVINVDIAIARAGYVVMLGGVLFGIGDGEVASDQLNVERSIPAGNVRIGELAGAEGVGLEGLIVDFNRAGVEVGYVNIVSACCLSQCHSFVDSSVAVVVDGYDGPRQGGIPSRDGSVLGAEQERCGLVVDLKVVLLALYTVPLGEPVPVPEAGGIVITSDCGCPEAMYVEDRPLLLSENHHGPAGLADMPQGFTRFASWKEPTALMSEVR